MYVWSTLHGIVSLSLSRVTLEVGDFSRYIDRMIDETLERHRGGGWADCAAKAVRLLPITRRAPIRR
jgi:hypothetical protein